MAAAPPPKADELQPHPPKEQLAGVSFCITSPSPWPIRLVRAGPSTAGAAGPPSGRAVREAADRALAVHALEPRHPRLQPPPHTGRALRAPPRPRIPVAAPRRRHLRLRLHLGDWGGRQHASPGDEREGAGATGARRPEAAVPDTP